MFFWRFDMCNICSCTNWHLFYNSYTTIFDTLGLGGIALNGAYPQAAIGLAYQPLAISGSAAGGFGGGGFAASGFGAPVVGSPGIAGPPIVQEEALAILPSLPPPTASNYYPTTTIPDSPLSDLIAKLPWLQSILNQGNNTINLPKGKSLFFSVNINQSMTKRISLIRKL